MTTETLARFVSHVDCTALWALVLLHGILVHYFLSRQKWMNPNDTSDVLTLMVPSVIIYPVKYHNSFHIKWPTRKHEILFTLGVFGPNSSRNFMRGSVHGGVSGVLNTFTAFLFVCLFVCLYVAVGIRTTNRNSLRKLHKLAIGFLKSLLHDSTTHKK